MHEVAKAGCTNSGWMEGQRDSDGATKQGMNYGATLCDELWSCYIEDKLGDGRSCM